MSKIPKASEIILDILQVLYEFRNEAGPSRDCFIRLGEVARMMYDKYDIPDGEPKQRVFHCFKSLHEDGFVRIPSLSQPNENGEVPIDDFLINITREGIEYLEGKKMKEKEEGGGIFINNESGMVNIGSSNNQITSNAEEKESKFMLPVIVAVVAGLIVAFLAYKLGWSN